MRSARPIRVDVPVPSVEESWQSCLLGKRCASPCASRTVAAKRKTNGTIRRRHASRCGRSLWCRGGTRTHRGVLRAGSRECNRRPQPSSARERAPPLRSEGRGVSYRVELRNPAATTDKVAGYAEQHERSRFGDGVGAGGGALPEFKKPARLSDGACSVLESVGRLGHVPTSAETRSVPVIHEQDRTPKIEPPRPDAAAGVRCQVG